MESDKYVRLLGLANCGICGWKPQLPCLLSGPRAEGGVGETAPSDPTMSTLMTPIFVSQDEKRSPYSSTRRRWGFAEGRDRVKTTY